MKIMVIGLDMYGYTSSLSRAFTDLGHDVEECIMNEVAWRYSSIGRVYTKCKTLKNKACGIDAIALSSKKNWNLESSKVLMKYESFKPDLVVSFAAYVLTPEVLDRMKYSKKILWIYDSIRRLPEIYPSLSCYDEIYTYERSDIYFFNQLGFEAKFLPLCVDENMYYQLGDKQEKIIDVSFIGSMTKARVRFLKKMVRKYPNLNFVFYGKYLQSYNLIGRLKRIISKEQECFMNRNISMEDSRILYSKSKICLNILQTQSQDGANMRLFELMRSGAFQIVSYTPYIDENFSDSVVTFVDEDDLFNKIEYYLKNDNCRDEYCANSIKKARESELFIHRASKMIQDL